MRRYGNLKRKVQFDKDKPGDSYIIIILYYATLKHAHVNEQAIISCMHNIV